MNENKKNKRNIILTQLERLPQPLLDCCDSWYTIHKILKIENVNYTANTNSYTWVYLCKKNSMLFVLYFWVQRAKNNFVCLAPPLSKMFRSFDMDE